jgi:phospholipid transport system substrate-binding protein
MRHYKSLPLLFLSFFLMLSVASANNTVSPDKLLKTNTYKLIDALKASKNELKQNPQIVHDLVTTHIAPQLDFIAASRWVLGKHWSEIDRDQKIRFIKEFRKLLILFYSVALSEYVSSTDIDHGIIQFAPLKNESTDTDVTVHSTVSPPNSKKKVSVNYHMHQTRKGWKIYDVSVEGISMIGTYKSSFEPQLRSAGVDELIKSLTTRNSKLSFKKTTLKQK